MFRVSLLNLGRHGAEIVAAVLVVALAAPAARAADDSPWQASAHSAVRLIAGGASTGLGARMLRGGVVIRLEPGWKTYWRYPGDSGVPPRFDFSRSDNVETVAVRWPAPRRFSDDGDTTIGYTGEVVFPLAIVPRDPRKPVTLRLDLDYAICEKLCVPADAKAELVLSGDPTSHDAALRAAESIVPKPAKLGDGSAFAIRAVTREAAEPRARVIVDVAVPPGADVDLFAEGPTPDWALPVPEPIPGAPAGLRRFRFEIDGVPTGASAAGAVLTLTAVSGAHAIEVTYRLD